MSGLDVISEINKKIESTVPEKQLVLMRVNDLFKYVRESNLYKDFNKIVSKCDFKVFCDNDLDTVRKHEVRVFINEYLINVLGFVKEDELDYTDDTEDYNIDSFFSSQLFSHKILTYEEEQELFKKYNETKDSSIKDEIIRSNYKLVRNIAKKSYRNNPNNSFNIYDLFQEGVIGLIDAIDRFDYKKGYKFSTYAIYWINQKINRLIEDKSKMIRIPSNMYKNISIVKNICDNFEKENGREPSVEEVMNLSGLKYEVVSYILNNNYQLTSLDVPVADESDSVLGDFIVSDCDVEEEICRNELKILVENLLHNADLSQKEIDVLCYRYGLYTGECMTLNEIGKIVGISKERVLQIESRAINRVRRKSIGTGIDKYVK